MSIYPSCYNTFSTDFFDCVKNCSTIHNYQSQPLAHPSGKKASTTLERICFTPQQRWIMYHSMVVCQNAGFHTPMAIKPHKQVRSPFMWTNTWCWAPANSLSLSNIQDNSGVYPSNSTYKSYLPNLYNRNPSVILPRHIRLSESFGSGCCLDICATNRVCLGAHWDGNLEIRSFD